MERIENNQTIILPKQENYTQFQYIFPLEIEEKVKNLTSSYVETFKKVMGGINLEKYKVSSNNKGREGYDYRAMLEMILFAYSERIFSVREMAKHCESDIRFMYITGDIQPSHNTIARFIRDELTVSIQDIFKEINEYIERKDNLDLETIYIDGTKIEANANKFSFVWKKATVNHQQKLMVKMSHALTQLNEYCNKNKIDLRYEVKEKYEVEEILEVYQDLEELVEKTGLKFVYGIGHRKSELQKHYEKIKELATKAMEYAEKIETCGNRNSYSKTDKDATFMHGKEDYYMKTGIFKAYYNLQIGVSNEYIRYLDVFQNASDSPTFQPFLEGFYETYGYYPKYPVADAGYGSYDNYRYCLENNMELVQKYAMFAKEHDPKFRKDPFNSYNYKTNDNGEYLCPNGCIFQYSSEKVDKRNGYEKRTKIYKVEQCASCPLRKQCHSHNKKDDSFKTMQVCDEWNIMKTKVKKNLTSERGIELRRQRSIQVEGAFGVIKEDLGYTRFHRRGLNNVRTEMFLLATGYNLKKFHNRTVKRGNRIVH